MLLCDSLHYNIPKIMQSIFYVICTRSTQLTIWKKFWINSLSPYWCLLTFVISSSCLADVRLSVKLFEHLDSMQLEMYISIADWAKRFKRNCSLIICLPINNTLRVKQHRITNNNFFIVYYNMWSSLFRNAYHVLSAVFLQSRQTWTHHCRVARQTPLNWGGQNQQAY